MPVSKDISLQTLLWEEGTTVGTKESTVCVWEGEGTTVGTRRAQCVCEDGSLTMLSLQYGDE